MKNYYNIGGILAGAGTGALSGASLGPVGAVVGGAIGLTSGIMGNKKKKDEEEMLKEQQQMAVQRKFDAGLNQARSAAFSDSINNPINPVEAGYAAYGGLLGSNEDLENINFNDSNTYNEGGTHEQNPHGGIPMGQGENGKMNTVEEGEVEIDLGKGNKYIFSDRLIYE